MVSIYDSLRFLILTIPHLFEFISLCKKMIMIKVLNSFVFRYTIISSCIPLYKTDISKS